MGCREGQHFAQQQHQQQQQQQQPKRAESQLNLFDLVDCMQTLDCECFAGDCIPVPAGTRIFFGAVISGHPSPATASAKILSFSAGVASAGMPDSGALPHSIAELALYHGHCPAGKVSPPMDALWPVLPVGSARE